MDCHLHFCAPDEARAPLLEEVQSIFGDNLTLHFDNGDPAQGIDLDRLLENPSEGEHVYVCGPAGLVGSVREKPLTGLPARSIGSRLLQRLIKQHKGMKFLRWCFREGICVLRCRRIRPYWRWSGKPESRSNPPVRMDSAAVAELACSGGCRSIVTWC